MQNRSSRRRLSLALQRSLKKGAQETEHALNERAMVKATNRLAYFTAALVFVAIVSAVVSFFQWQEMKSTGGQTDKLITANQTLADAAINNVKIARDSMIASERAWVGPINAKLKGDLKAGAPLDIVTQYQNTGKEPAVNFRSDVKIRVFSASEDDSGGAAQVIGLDTSACFDMEGTRESQVIFPTTGFADYESTKTLEAESIDETVISEAKHIVLTGCFAYRTQQSIHHTSFCFYFIPGKTDREHLGICEAGHRAD
jgi:hypothetical protein